MKLNFEKNNLISFNQFKNHIELYEGYINKVNNIDDNIFLRKDFQYALNGVVLHELYFDNIGLKKSTYNKKIFNNDEQFYKWRDEFINIAMSTRGWIIYAYELRTNKFFNFSLISHDEGLVCGMIPIIVLDMYEHAYYTDYGNNKKEYIEKFIDNIDWEIIENRINKI